MVSKKHKKTCATLNYVEHLLILVSAVTECISIFVFASLVDILVGITSFALTIKSCAITGKIEKYKSTINKKEKTMIK